VADPQILKMVQGRKYRVSAPSPKLSQMHNMNYRRCFAFAICHGVQLNTQIILYGKQSYFLKIKVSLCGIVEKLLIPIVWEGRPRHTSLL